MDSSKKIPLSGGRSLALSQDNRALRIADQNGAIEVEIELRETGPVVRVRAAALQIETDGNLSVGCERFELRARDGIQLISDRDLKTSAAGDLDFCAGRHAHWEGKSVRVRANRGELQLEATDDIRVDGERILLNS